MKYKDKRDSNAADSGKRFGRKCQYRRQKRLSLAALDELDVLVREPINCLGDIFRRRCVRGTKGRPASIARRCRKAMKRGRQRRKMEGEWNWEKRDYCLAFTSISSELRNRA